jgi:hypothetical protein
VARLSFWDMFQHSPNLGNFAIFGRELLDILSKAIYSLAPPPKADLEDLLAEAERDVNGIKRDLDRYSLKPDQIDQN